jgi:flagellar motor switch protein FliN
MNDFYKNLKQKMYDIPVEITVRLGKINMVVSDILNLGPGTIIEMNENDIDYAHIYVGDKLIAIGEVVTINNNKFGVRVIDFVKKKYKKEGIL